MAFNLQGLARNSSGVGNNSTLWAYTSEDAAATVLGANYFLPAIGEMEIGDQVTVYDSNLATMTISYVTGNNGTTITCASGTLIGNV